MSEAKCWDDTITELNLISPERRQELCDSLGLIDPHAHRQLGPMDHGMIEFPSGATRGTDVDHLRFDLTSPIAMGRVAAISAEGAQKYGDRNWEKGMPKSVMMNHALNHMNEYMAGSTDEDHIAKVVWNLMAIMHFEGKGMEGY